MVSEVEQRSRLFLSIVTVASIGMIFIGLLGIYIQQWEHASLTEPEIVIQESQSCLSEEPTILVHTAMPKEKTPVTFVTGTFAIFMFCCGLLPGLGVLQFASLAIKAIERSTPLSKWMKDMALIIPFTAFMLWWTARILEPFHVF